MNIFSKIKFLIHKPKIVIVTGLGRKCAREAVFQVLKHNFRIGKDVLIFETDLKDKKESEELKDLVKGSSLSVLIVTHSGQIPFDRDYFAAERETTKEILDFAKSLPSQVLLVLNFDDETIREIGDVTNLKTCTFGFQEGADFKASDINLNGGTNFKINFRGSIVPVWLEGLFGKEQIYSALVAACAGEIFDFNLVELSQALRNYNSLPGKMRLIKGINDSRILDDSEGATIFSMIEAIEILGKIQGSERKIAVLGDVVGVGKYTAEAHETLGEKVALNANLLFTFGSRAKFIAEGAKAKGMTVDKIFEFDTINDGKLKLREEMRKGGLVLIDGSKEMKMSDLVQEIKERG